MGLPVEKTADFASTFPLGNHDHPGPSLTTHPSIPPGHTGDLTCKNLCHMISVFLRRKKNLIRRVPTLQIFCPNMVIYIDSLLGLSQIFNSVLAALIRLIQI